MPFEIVDIDTSHELQDIKIPEKFKIDDNKAYLKKTGNVIYIIPFHSAWEAMENGTHNFSDDYMEYREQPADQARETFDP